MDQFEVNNPFESFSNIWSIYEIRGEGPILER